jgi:deoxyribonuclease-4
MIGIHVSNINDIVLYNDKYNIKFFQLFVSPLEDYNSSDNQKIIKEIKKRKITIVIHGSYSANLARNWKTTDWFIQQYIQEIKACELVGAYGIIIHTGKSLNLTLPEAINNMYSSLMYIHQQTMKSNVKIIIETSSGQGSETLTDVNDLCKFMNKFFNHPKKNVSNRFGLCIDTCHIFAAGYDIRNNKETINFFKIIKETIGIDKIKLCHVNDSKGDIGSKIDRHQNIGLGKIGKKGIFNIIKLMNTLQVPMVLETPHSNIINDYNIIQKHIKES